MHASPLRTVRTAHSTSAIITCAESWGDPNAQTLKRSHVQTFIMRCMQEVEEQNASAPGAVTQVVADKQTTTPTAKPGIASAVAGVLLAYGAIAIFLQLEVPAKLIRGAMGYSGWL